MSDRFCPSCGRLIGWGFITRADGKRDLVQCRDLPDSYARNTVDNFMVRACAQMDADDAREAMDDAARNKTEAR